MLLRRASRLIHTVPELGLKRELGIPGLLSSKGLDVAWFQYQSHLVSRVNALLEKHPQYSSAPDMFELLAQTQSSVDPGVREITVLASQAFNNEFFFRSLKPSVNPDAHIGATAPNRVDISTECLNKPENTVAAPPSPRRLSVGDLNELIDQSFDSLVSLRELLVNRADSMFGNGYVWILHHMSLLSAVNTYNWASPYSHENMYAETSEDLLAELDEHRIKLFAPVLCISAWEHVYLHDYGVAGKRDYLRNAFDCIDWAVVLARLPARTY